MSSLAFLCRRLATLLAIAILTLTFIGVTSGILLSFYYQPSAGGAYDSLKMIDETIPYGWLILSMHSISGNVLIVASLIQIVVMFIGERLRRSWFVAWISGVLMALAAIGASWTAMILGWDQLGYWRLKIELGTIEAIPLIGPSLRDILTGGAVGTTTVEHLYTIHSYLVSLGAVGLSIIHLVGLLVQEREMQAERELILARSEKAQDARDARSIEEAKVIS